MVVGPFRPQVIEKTFFLAPTFLEFARLAFWPQRLDRVEVCHYLSSNDKATGGERP